MVMVIIRIIANYYYDLKPWNVPHTRNLDAFSIWDLKITLQYTANIYFGINLRIYFVENAVLVPGTAPEELPEWLTSNFQKSGHTVNVADATRGGDAYEGGALDVYFSETKNPGDMIHFGGLGGGECLLCNIERYLGKSP